MCRTPISLPDRAYGDDRGEVSSARTEGLMHIYHISEPRAAEIYDILRLSTRQLLTIYARMPVIWSSVNLVSNLPKLMVTIARRFYYKSIGQPIPSDLSCIRRSIYVSRFSDFWNRRDLEFHARADAPLAQHPDAYELHEFLRMHMPHLQNSMADKSGVSPDWTKITRNVLSLVKQKMPDLDGDISNHAWDAYIYCVLHALFIWQAYCLRIQVLTCPELGNSDV